MKKIDTKLYWYILAFVITLLIMWETRWVLSMQVLLWEIKVSEVAQFRCRVVEDKISWRHNSIYMDWSCKD